MYGNYEIIYRFRYFFLIFPLVILNYFHFVNSSTTEEISVAQKRFPFCKSYISSKLYLLFFFEAHHDCRGFLQVD